VNEIVMCLISHRSYRLLSIYSKITLLDTLFFFGVNLYSIFSRTKLDEVEEICTLFLLYNEFSLWQRLAWGSWHISSS